jgi:hypothetical protein
MSLRSVFKFVFQKVGTCLLIFCGTFATGQVTTTPPIDIYAGFVGTWTGLGEYDMKGTHVAQPITISITETKKRDALKCEYVYGTKGKKYFSRDTRVIVFDRVRSVMKSHWKGKSSDVYQLEKFQAFAATGLGTFTAVAHELDQGRPAVFVGLFHLERNNFSYKWDKSFDGKTFVPYGSFTLTRVLNS